MANNFPIEIKVYFKGDSSSLKTETAMYSSINSINFSKEYERLLLNIQMMGEKFSVIFSPASKDYEKITLDQLMQMQGGR